MIVRVMMRIVTADEKRCAVVTMIISRAQVSSNKTLVSIDANMIVITSFVGIQVLVVNKMTPFTAYLIPTVAITSISAYCIDA